ncbi:MAG: AAA family ATPase [Nanopusillaceae archaeon]
MHKTIRVTQIRLIDRALLIGGPGLGKTQLVRQLAEKEAKMLNRQFVDLREADKNEIDDIIKNPSRYYVYARIIAPHVFPEDITIPRYGNYTNDEYTEFTIPKMLYILTLKEIAGVLFIDELSNVVREDQMSMYYSLILEREFGWGGKLAPGVKIVAAANSEEWSEIVRPLPKPLRNRLVLIYVAPPSVDEWISFMNSTYGDKWEKLVGAYLRVFPEDMLQPPEGDWDAFPTPRSWSNLALLLKQYENEPDEFKESLIIGSVGNKIGIKFATIYAQRKNMQKLIEDVFAEPKLFAELKIEEKVLVVSHLSQLSIDELKERAERLVEYMAENTREWLVTLFALYEPKKRMEALRKIKATRVIIDIVKEWS